MFQSHTQNLKRKVENNFPSLSPLPSSSSSASSPSSAIDLSLSLSLSSHSHSLPRNRSVGYYPSILFGLFDREIYEIFRSLTNLSLDFVTVVRRYAEIILSEESRDCRKTVQRMQFADPGSEKGVLSGDKFSEMGILFKFPTPLHSSPPSLSLSPSSAYSSPSSSSTNPPPHPPTTSYHVSARG